MAAANTTAKLSYTIKCSGISGTQPIPTLTLKRVLSNGTAVNLTTTTSTSITFTLQSPLPSDTGVYVCIATNSLGNDTRQLNLTVQGESECAVNICMLAHVCACTLVPLTHVCTCTLVPLTHVCMYTSTTNTCMCMYTSTTHICVCACTLIPLTHGRVDVHDYH